MFPHSSAFSSETRKKDILDDDLFCVLQLQVQESLQVFPVCFFEENSNLNFAMEFKESLMCENQMEL